MQLFAILNVSKYFNISPFSPTQLANNFSRRGGLSCCSVVESQTQWINAVTDRRPKCKWDTWRKQYLEIKDMMITFQINLERRKRWRMNTSWHQTDEHKHVRFKYFTLYLKSLKKETDFNSSQLQCYHPTQWSRIVSDVEQQTLLRSLCELGLTLSVLEKGCSPIKCFRDRMKLLKLGRVVIEDLGWVVQVCYACRASTSLAGSWLSRCCLGSFLTSSSQGWRCLDFSYQTLVVSFINGDFNKLSSMEFIWFGFHFF